MSAARRELRLLLLGRGLRAGVDACVAVLLPAYLLALGHGVWEVGVLSTATLLGSALATLALGAWGHRAPQRSLLLGAALLMAATGLGFAGLTGFWPLLLVAFLGTLNPGSGDVSVFLPLEHARLAQAGEGADRTRIFARYSLIGALCGAFGALAAGLPELLAASGIDHLDALRGMFLVYAGVGLLIWRLYARIPLPAAHEVAPAPAPLSPSRGGVVKLALLFSVDAFAGGLAAPLLACGALKIAYDLALWRAFRHRSAPEPPSPGTDHR